MTFIPVPSGVSITFNWSNGTTLAWKNRIWATKAGFTQSDLQTLADHARTAFANSTLPNLLSNDFRLDSVTVTDETSEGAPSEISTGAVVGGGNASPALPLQTAMVVTLRTNKRGRSYRGRMYMSGFTEADIEDGIFAAALETAVLAFLTSLDGYINSDGFDWVIATKQHNHQTISPAETNSVQERLVRSRIPGSQRRRNRRP